MARSTWQALLQQPTKMLVMLKCCQRSSMARQTPAKFRRSQKTKHKLKIPCPMETWYPFSFTLSPASDDTGKDPPLPAEGFQTGCLKSFPPSKSPPHVYECSVPFVSPAVHTPEDRAVVSTWDLFTGQYSLSLCYVPGAESGWHQPGQDTVLTRKGFLVSWGKTMLNQRLANNERHMESELSPARKQRQWLSFLE